MGSMLLYSVHISICQTEVLRFKSYESYVMVKHLFADNVAEAIVSGRIPL